MSDKIHAGLWLDCKNCNQDWKPKKRERKTTVRFSGEMSVEIAVRRQVAAELGDVEPSKEHKYALLQKYGAVAARIDRKVTKPMWMEEQTWILKSVQFNKATKGLVPARQERRSYPSGSSQGTNNSRQNRQPSPTGQRYPYRGNPALDKGKYFGPRDSNSSRTSRPSFNRTRTETPQQ